MLVLDHESDAAKDFRYFAVSTLPELYQAFDLLDRGVSVCLEDNARSERAVDAREHFPSAALGTHLGVWSSGSTGRPKLVWRSWSALKCELQTGERFAKWRWASPFSPCSYAGVQVAMQAWASQGTVRQLPQEFSAALALLVDLRIEALSCTPTFLDLLVQFASGKLSHWVPRQITLGGEPLRPATGTRLKNAFSPDTRFTIIYASAERGILLKTHRLDGWYEVASLEKRYPAWRATNGALEILCEGAWLPTGDLVEVSGELMRLIGRADHVANVAGCKVRLDDVAAAAEQVHGVRAATAFAEPSPVTGQIVVLHVSPAECSLPADLELRVMEHLRSKLPKEAWPRRFEIASVTLGPNAKRRVSANTLKSE